MIATRFCAAVTVFTFAVTGAFAQTALPRNGAIPEGYITVQSSIALSLPFDQSAVIDEQVQKAQKALYNIASRNCSSGCLFSLSNWLIRYPAEGVRRRRN